LIAAVIKIIQSNDRWVIQEQFVNFLDISGFKRKYPNIYRRRLENDEVKHLYELKENVKKIFLLIHAKLKA
jgi:hypothetical protein